MPVTFRRHRARAPQLERETSLVPIAAARQVVEALSLWLGVPLHGSYARRLAFQARRCYVPSDLYRAKLRRPPPGRASQPLRPPPVRLRLRGRLARLVAPAG